MKILLACLLSLSLWACSSAEKSPITTKQNLRYKEDRKSLPKNLQGYFPKEIPAQTLSSQNLGVKRSDSLGLKWEILWELPKEEVQKLHDKMQHKALQTGPANASYLVINPRFSRDHGFFPKRQADQETYPYPVPTFWGYGGEHQPGRLPNGFQIYLLFAKKVSSVAYGWQEAYTYGVATDSTWRSGQCVGLALNPSKGQVIHWVEIW